MQSVVSMLSRVNPQSTVHGFGLFICRAGKGTAFIGWYWQKRGFMRHAFGEIREQTGTVQMPLKLDTLRTQQWKRGSKCAGLQLASSGISKYPPSLSNEGLANKTSTLID